MALRITEPWIRERVKLKHDHLGMMSLQMLHFLYEIVFSPFLLLIFREVVSNDGFLLICSCIPTELCQCFVCSVRCRNVVVQYLIDSS